MNIAECTRRGHWVFRNELVEFCFVCHYRTDQAFAIYSQQLLARIMAEELKKAA